VQSVERFVTAAIFSSNKEKKMRACFLGQNVCALGYGVATLQIPPLQDEDALQDAPRTHDGVPAPPTPPGAGASPGAGAGPGAAAGTPQKPVRL
jgi:hypothetical protein